MFDVDRFKSYNDAFGHPAGDEALRTVGSIVKKSVRDHDTAARFGGDTRAHAAAVVALLERLRPKRDLPSWNQPGRTHA
jgi:diguanylate cyclase (GGDEF)-like protein